jgi:hypothetical protein
MIYKLQNKEVLYKQNNKFQSNTYEIQTIIALVNMFYITEK